MLVLSERTELHVPELHVFEENGITYAVDEAAPNWVAVDEAGARLLTRIRAAAGTGSPLAFGALVAATAAEQRLEAGKAWLFVHDFLRGLDRARMLSDAPFAREPYPGRSALVAPERLRELWIQINNACNLTCTHCLVSSGPGGAPGVDADALLRLVDRAAALGMERLYVTGGEPFLRRDIFDLAKRATERHGAELIVLTNATVFQGPVRKGLETLDRAKVRFQVSIDGARPETNDPIRGAGTFDKALDGARLLADLGFDVSLTTVTTEENLAELADIPAIVKSVGAKSQHLMWSHRRGRARESDNGFFPENAALLDAVLAVVDAAKREGTTLDNLEATKRRVNGVPGVKYDLGNAGWDSVCVYADGRVFPSAALAGEEALVCGDVTRQELSRRSLRSRETRSASSRAAATSSMPGASRATSSAPIRTTRSPSR
jgi:MoaA/NifB/PqqE/SkfB family radical SAM enzyme